MNFAPYQDVSPELGRALSPPNHRRSTSSPRPSFSPPNKTRRTFSPTQWNFMQSSPFSPALGRGDYDDLEAGNGGRATLGAFETSLPMRVDYEAMMAYLLVPPAGGLFLLIFEHKSDYVRFHAWQSSMLFSVILVAHILISWSSILSWLLFICDIGLIALLSLHAYQDVDSLEHYEVPFFGRLANSFIDDE